MKIALLSDIHGNYAALSSVLEDIRTQRCDRVISLGDVCGYYSQVNECIDALRTNGILHLMGNHDRYILLGQPCPRSISANLCLDYQRGIVTPQSMDFLASSPCTYALPGYGISLVHGGWHDPVDEYMHAASADYFQGLPGVYFFSGHTHIQWIQEMDGITYCNPGAVGQPRDGNPKAAYCLWEDGRITLRRVAYNIDKTAAHMRAGGLPEYLSQCLYRGERVSYQRSKGKET